MGQPGFYHSLRVLVDAQFHGLRFQIPVHKLWNKLMSFFLRKLFRKSEPIPPGSRTIKHSEAEDIFIIGFPKSGHTWMQNLVAHALYGNEGEPALPKRVVHLIPDIHHLKFYERHQSPMFFKAHSLPEARFKRVIYLLRDGRDVMVSYWHYIQALESREVNFLRMVQTGEGFFPPVKWHEHVGQWLSNPFGGEIITVRYEDLKKDAATELERVFAFAKLDVSRPRIERAVTRSSFEKMQRNEKENWQHPPQWDKSKMFIRRGETGSYQDEMPADVQAAFMADASPMMQKLGYANA